MTIRQSAAELHTPREDINTWLEQCNTPFYCVAAHRLDTDPEELSVDGEQVIRDLHLEHTHPEIHERINNLTKTILDQRKEISNLQKQVADLSITY